MPKCNISRFRHLFSFAEILSPKRYPIFEPEENLKTIRERDLKKKNKIIYIENKFHLEKVNCFMDEILCSNFSKSEKKICAFLACSTKHLCCYAKMVAFGAHLRKEGIFPMERGKMKKIKDKHVTKLQSRAGRV